MEVKATDNRRDVFLVTKKGMCIRFHETDVRSTGRVSMGVIGMSLNDGDQVVGMQVDTRENASWPYRRRAWARETEIDEFKPQKRGGKGVLCYKITEKTGDLIGAKLVFDDHDVMLITHRGHHHPSGSERHLHLREKYIRRQADEHRT